MKAQKRIFLKLLVSGVKLQRSHGTTHCQLYVPSDQMEPLWDVDVAGAVERGHVEEHAEDEAQDDCPQVAGPPLAAGLEDGDNVAQLEEGLGADVGRVGQGGVGGGRHGPGAAGLGD